ncbi:MAG: OstA-like protein [Phycisphaerales bacterium]|nr:OstA-like protein [Phycisphaerales bacterium]
MKYVVFSIAFLIGVVLVSVDKADAANTKRIHIIHANKITILSIDSTKTELQILVGDVALQENKTLFYCDSAILDQAHKIMEAFNHVHIIDKDSLTIYSDYLKYNSETKSSLFKYHVVLIDKKSTLKTDELEYYTKEDLAIYHNNGTLYNGNSTLTSKDGYFYANRDKAYFYHQVVLHNPTTIIRTDTMIYETQKEIVDFVVPTVIQNATTKILTHDGFFNTKTKDGLFFSRSSIIDSASTLIADTIHLNDSLGTGHAIGKAIFKDTVQGIKITANDIKSQRTYKEILATIHPILYIIQTTDTIACAGDTLYSAKLSYFVQHHFYRNIEDEEDFPNRKKGGSTKHAFSLFNKEDRKRYLQDIAYQIEDAEVFNIPLFTMHPFLLSQKQLFFNDTNYIKNESFYTDTNNRNTDTHYFSPYITPQTFYFLYDNRSINALLTIKDTFLPKKLFTYLQYQEKKIRAIDSVKVLIPMACSNCMQVFFYHPHHRVIPLSAKDSLILRKKLQRYVVQQNIVNRLFNFLSVPYLKKIIDSKGVPNFHYVPFKDTIVDTPIIVQTFLEKVPSLITEQLSNISIRAYRDTVMQLIDSNRRQLSKLLDTINKEPLRVSGLHDKQLKALIAQDTAGMSEKLETKLLNLIDTVKHKFDETKLQKTPLDSTMKNVIVNTVSMVANKKSDELSDLLHNSQFSLNPIKVAVQQYTKDSLVLPKHLNDTMKQLKDISKDTIGYHYHQSARAKVTKIDSINVEPPVIVDTTKDHFFMLYHHVRIFHDSLQGVCDSLFYSLNDSTFRMYQTPILWAQKNQLTGDSMFIFTKNNKPRKLFVPTNSMAISLVLDSFFNQIKGVPMRIYFNPHSQVDSIKTKGSPAKSIYFSESGKNKLAAMNASNSQFITLIMKDLELYRVVLLRDVTGVAYPMRSVNSDNSFLQGFNWQIYKRPLSKQELITGKVLTHQDSLRFNLLSPIKRKLSLQADNQ